MDGSSRQEDFVDHPSVKWWRKEKYKTILTLNLLPKCKKTVAVDSISPRSLRSVFSLGIMPGHGH